MILKLKVISCLPKTLYTIEQILESEANQETDDDKFNRVDILTQNSKNELIIIEIQSGNENKWHQFRSECLDANYNITHEKIRRFLSEICWLYWCKVEVLTHWGSLNMNSRFEWIYQYYNRIKGGLNLESYQQIATIPEQKVALWIYREAQVSKSVFYEFLCYGKIINLVSSEWKKQIKWINDNLQHIYCKDEIANIEQEVTARLNINPNDSIKTVGDHLYVLGRCAIAHASPWLDKVADADNFNDYNRIYRDMKVMLDLAKQYINKELNILTHSELCSLQNIQRFQNYYGQDLIDKVVHNQISEIDIKWLPSMPLAYLRLKWHEYVFSYFKDIEFSIMTIKDGKIYLSNELQEHDTITTWLILDLVNKEILFEAWDILLNKEKYKIDKQMQIDYLTFLKHYFKNGTLEVIEQNSSKLITRTWPHMFVNVDIESVRSFQNNINKDLSILTWNEL